MLFLSTFGKIAFLASSLSALELLFLAVKKLPWVADPERSEPKGDTKTDGMKFPFLMLLLFDRIWFDIFILG